MKRVSLALAVSLTTVVVWARDAESRAKKGASMTSSVVQANNQLAMDLYSRFRAQEAGNIFLSPYSIETALSMTLEGARGDTADEMRKVLRLPLDPMAVQTAFNRIQQAFSKKDNAYALNSANALWAQKDYPFLTEYFALVERYYEGKATNLDFKGDPEAARKTINDWVKHKTADKISNLIPPRAIGPMTRLVLTNAIYFKGRWAFPFEKRFTKDENFHVNATKTIKIPMMRPTGHTEFSYGESNGLQMLEMPYAGGRLSMLLLLPKSDSLPTLENSLTVEKLQTWEGLLRETDVDVFLPKFKFETKYFMAKVLKEMGMPAAFSNAADYGGSADFSGMTGKKDLFIGEVIHQAFVEVSEEGTEAAAATAVVVPEGAAFHAVRRPVFRADHPFLFLIKDKETGIILFLGRVADPS